MGVGYSARSRCGVAASRPSLSLPGDALRLMALFGDAGRRCVGVADDVPDAELSRLKSWAALEAPELLEVEAEGALSRRGRLGPASLAAGWGMRAECVRFSLTRRGRVSGLELFMTRLGIRNSLAARNRDSV